MHLIVCLDERDGMLFNKRRQSKDRLLRQRVLEMTGESLLWMDAYTAGQFEEEAGHIRVSETPLEQAGAGEYCFLEKGDPAACTEKVESVIIYRWDKRYPSDVKFPTDLFTGKWTPVSVVEFPGHSHEVIQEERYVL